MDKTFTLVGGVVPKGEDTSKRFRNHDYTLQYRDQNVRVVDLFKYLGLHFDGSSSTRSMVHHRVQEARKA